MNECGLTLVRADALKRAAQHVVRAHMWRAVLTQADADDLMQQFAHFHDGCIREAHVWGGHYVHPDLKMTCGETPDLKCRVVVQRQWADPSVIELLFDRVSRFVLAAPFNYDRIIMGATLLLKGDELLWSPDDEYDEACHDNVMSSVIVSRKLWWRPLPDALGAHLRYGIPAELPQGFAL